MQRSLQVVIISFLLAFGNVHAFAQQAFQGSALQRLSSAKIFALGPVGFAYRTSQEEIDYRIILSQPTALASFEKLYTEGNLQAKSYALAGFRELSPEKFKELYASLPDSGGKVRAMSGCVMTDKTLRDVAEGLVSPTSPAK